MIFKYGLSLNSRSSSASGTLELPALGTHAGSSVGALLSRSQTEVPLGLSVSGASQEQHVLAGGGKLGELIEGVGLSSSSHNPLSGGSGELKGGDSESLGDVEEPDVVGDGADDGDDA